MSCIPLTTSGDATSAAREFMRRRSELNVFRLLAGAPTVFDGWTRMVDAQLDSTTFSTTFSARLRELVILRVAHLQRCRYALAQHTDVARSVGLTDDEIATVTTNGLGARA
jgi:4-carboxymuconolactone decarboxylase